MRTIHEKAPQSVDITEPRTDNESEDADSEKTAARTIAPVNLEGDNRVHPWTALARRVTRGKNKVFRGADSFEGAAG